MNPLVLTIDDDPAITDLLSVLLSATGFDVMVANSGTEGLRMIREQAPRIVVLDLMMPDVDGWQVCKAVRGFSSVPILVLSALDEPSIVASVLDLGADDFLVKPVPSAVLVAHLNKLARRTETFHRFPHDRSRWQPAGNPSLT
jgi:two-component system, OmpR family, response regulator MprA